MDNTNLETKSNMRLQIDHCYLSETYILQYSVLFLSPGHDIKPFQQFIILNPLARSSLTKRKNKTVY